MINAARFEREIAEISRHSTTVIADAMGKFGGVPDLDLIAGHPPETRIAGPVYYVETYRGSNWPCHEQLQDLPANCVVFVEPIRCGKRAIFGEIVMDYIVAESGAKGAVVNGYMRDIEALIPKKYPLWYKGNNPVGCFNRKIEIPDGTTIKEHLEPNREHYDHPENALCVADVAGVVIIPEEKIEETYRRVREIAVLEKIWFACIEAGLNTYETVCARVYERPDELTGDRFAKVREHYRELVELREEHAKTRGGSAQ